VTLTGWTAILGITSLILILGVGVVVGYRKYKGMPFDSQYTVVLKGGKK
jgi:Golgi apparatus protein 1